MTRQERATLDVQLVEQYTDRIHALMAQATDHEMRDGLRWYDNARQFCYKLSNQHKVPFNVVCAVVSALSPNTGWERNKLDAKMILMGFKSNHRHITVSTYHRNLLKAWDILDSCNVSLIKAPKTSAFYHNMAFEDSDLVTVDTHSWSAVTGIRYTAGSQSKMPTITPRRYRNASAAYRNVAQSMALRPYQVQAITWLVWKRINDIQAR